MIRSQGMKQTCLTGLEASKDAVVLSLRDVTPKEIETCLNVFVRSFQISAIAIRRSGGHS